MSRQVGVALGAGFAALFAFVSFLSAQTSDGGALSTFSTDFFSGSGDCATCHTELTDTAGNDVSFDANWRSSIMANSARDPLWQAKVESETLRTPSLKSAIEDTCTRCHMPMAHVQATADGTSTAMFGAGFLNTSNSLHEAAMDGTSCALCHQISSTNLGDPSTFDGHFPIDTVTTMNRAIYGKYLDPNVNNMSGYTATGSAHVEDAALCATCHTLFTTPVAADGTPIAGADEFPEQTPYQEWEHSDFGDGVGTDVTCQECHMPVISGTAPLTKRGNSPDRSGFGRHYFLGGNAFMLSILRDNGVELGVTASTDQFNDTIARTEAQLANDTAVLAITSASMTSNTQLTVDLQVSNLAGHKFPSGIPLRRAWIHLRAVDGDGQLLFESGAPLADGRIQGNDADSNPTTYEPHYDLINAAGQVQIYEGIMADANGQVTYTLLRAAAFAKDNRLLPQGFDKATAPDDVQVHGGAQSDANFIGGSDTIRYEIPLLDPTINVTVSAELLYQPLSYAAAHDLASDTTGTTVNRFTGYYNAADLTPDTIATASTVVAPPTTSLSGVVQLQGRAQPGTAGTIKLIDLDGNFTTQTLSFDGLSGAFALQDVPVLPDGSHYRLEAAHALYLSNVLLPTITAVPFNPPTTTLRGGDANLDLSINIQDLSCIGGAYLGPPALCGAAGSSDINGDGLVNITDLTLAGGNYQLSGFQSW